ICSTELPKVIVPPPVADGPVAASAAANAVSICAGAASGVVGARSQARVTRLRPTSTNEAHRMASSEKQGRGSLAAPATESTAPVTLRTAILQVRSAPQDR